MKTLNTTAKKWVRRTTAFPLLIIVLLPFLIPDPIHPLSFQESLHGNRDKLPKGCQSCHKGHGKFRLPDLPTSGEILCFRCHGDGHFSESARKSGDLSPSANPTNIQNVFEKAYRHPIEQATIKYARKTVPENDPSAPRPVWCKDCHNPHFMTKDDYTSAVKGVTVTGSTVDRIGSGYELCFKCHSFSANLPGDQTNKAELFDPANPSYHPVVAAGKNTQALSLLPRLNEKSRIRCTDCHGNDDPLGPRGPHGSIYRHILSKNFSPVAGPEDIHQYELCYSCHNRNSILGNHSFPYHELHIVAAMASCRICHNPHGSVKYTHLIDFENLSIRPSNNGKLDFWDLGDRSGKCFLNCHGKDHDGAMYPADTIRPSSMGSSSRRRN